MQYYSNLDQNWTLGSHIMAVEVSGYRTLNLANPVIITFRKSNANKYKREKFSCVFWNISIGGNAFIHLVGWSGSLYTVNDSSSKDARFVHKLSFFDVMNKLTQGK